MKVKKEELLPDYIDSAYKKLQYKIKERLKEFEQVPKSEYFYEFCFCICTPQSKASNAIRVIEILKQREFRKYGFNPVRVLRDSAHYIRFHNQKALRLLMARDYFPEILEILGMNKPKEQKRMMILEKAKGFGMKESSHFLRNIGYKGLTILDRHILKHLVLCGVLNEIPKIISIKKYLEIEDKYISFSQFVGIPVDELDLLFWSYETGEILK